MFEMCSLVRCGAVLTHFLFTRQNTGAGGQKVGMGTKVKDAITRAISRPLFMHVY